MMSWRFLGAAALVVFLPHSTRSIVR